MDLAETRIVHISIAVPFDVAYEFAHQPVNFTKWAAGLSASLHHTEQGWVASTPDGEAIVQFSERNEFGVLDHRVTVPGRPEALIPLRMIPNGGGTEVELVLFRQPHMTDQQFEQDAALVEKDLASLKAVLEG